MKTYNFETTEQRCIDGSGDSLRDKLLIERDRNAKP